MHVKRIEDEVIRLGKEFPDLVYEKDTYCCKYAYPIQSNGIGGCIIGQAIQNLYPELKEKLVGFDAEDDGLLADVIIERLFGEECTRFLLDVQECQDCGYSWQDAVNKSQDEN